MCVADCAVPENIHSFPPPPQKGLEFPGWGGGGGQEAH